MGGSEGSDTGGALNLAGLLWRSARAHPQASALALGTRVVADYASLATRVQRLAAALCRRFGLQPGERIALFMANTPQYVELLYACWHAGLVAVPINARLHAKELRFILADCGARLCFVSADTAPAAQQAVAVNATASVNLNDAPEPAACLSALIDVASRDYQQLLQAADDASCVLLPPADIASTGLRSLAWLFYTSGTTGRPKGVMLSHRNLLAMTLNYFSDVDAIAPGDCLLHAAPMSHGSGLYIPPHVAQAALNVIPESGGFEPEEIASLLRRHRGMTLFAAPTMLKRLLTVADRLHLPHLKTIVYGGGPMYLADAQQALAVLGPRLVQIYGQGESPMTITALARHWHVDDGTPGYAARLASVGLAQTGIALRIAPVDEEAEVQANTPQDHAPNYGPNHAPNHAPNHGDASIAEALPAGEIGEILVRGDTVMQGYWNNPQATARTLRHGWLHTGDVGVLDAAGFLTLKDRSKDVIISGGSNIYPREVEEVLLQHAGVLEVSVIGQPHAEWGEQVVACVVLRDGAQPQQQLQQELDGLCLAHIARFKRPKRYLFLPALPKNMTGKVLKTELRAML